MSPEVFEGMDLDMKRPAYRTPLGAVSVYGWARLGTLPLEVMLQPANDQDRGGFAHISYQDALAIAEREGARLPGTVELLELHRVGKRLKPVILPTPAMVKRMRPRFLGGRDAAGERVAAEPEEAYQARIRENMGSLLWCDLHDSQVLEQLTDWDGKTPVTNAGKLWRAGAPKGRAYLGGWWDGAKFIQAIGTGGNGPHEGGHFDYATLLQLVRPLR